MVRDGSSPAEAGRKNSQPAAAQRVSCVRQVLQKRSADLAILARRIQNDFTYHVEPDSRRIQVVNGPQSQLLSGLFRASQAFSNQLIEQINRIILGHGLEHMCECDQCGDAAFRRHARDLPPTLLQHSGPVP